MSSKSVNFISPILRPPEILGNPWAAVAAAVVWSDRPPRVTSGEGDSGALPRHLEESESHWLSALSLCLYLAIPASPPSRLPLLRPPS
jgi:hypothetical protein